MSRYLSVSPIQLKPFVLPKGLIYHVPDSTLYNLFETKKGSSVGYVLASVTRDVDKMYGNKTDTKVFYVDTLVVYNSKQGKGWGKYLIDFIKNESIAQGCGGRVSLYACNWDKPPHIFYRKQGFASKVEQINSRMDFYMKKDIIPYHWGGLDMYLPINNSSEIKCKKDEKFNLQKCVDNICDFFKFLWHL